MPYDRKRPEKHSDLRYPCEPWMQNSDSIREEGREVREAELAVIGAGPAGIAACVEAASSHVPVILLDENDQLGGRAFRGLENDKTARLFERQDTVGRNLIAEFLNLKSRIIYYPFTTVWGIFEQRELAIHSEVNGFKGEKYVRAKKIVLATGAFERPIPFPGWTLPGVFSAGGLNLLVKDQKILPGKRFVLAGTGPLQMALAYNLIKAGGHIQAIVESASFSDSFLRSRHLLCDWETLQTGLKYVMAVKRQQVPFYHSHIISKAAGETEVREATIVKVDRSSKPINGTEKKIPTDAVAIGYGLIPSVELAKVCGCRTTYDHRAGYRVVQRNLRMQTSIPGIFVAGDGGGVRGYLSATQEGRIAGIEASRQLGYLDEAAASRRIRISQRNLTRTKRMSRILNEFFEKRAGLCSIIRDDTVICRCEQTKMADILSAIADGVRDINHLKRKTRVGMGYCQGRFCQETALDLLQTFSNESVERQYLNTRVPVKPIPFETLL
jgi:thioredoxin reductase